MERARVTLEFNFKILFLIQVIKYLNYLYEFLFQKLSEYFQVLFSQQQKVYLLKLNYNKPLEYCPSILEQI